MSPALLEAIRQELGPLTSPAKAARVVRAVLEAVREPSGEMHDGLTALGRALVADAQERDQWCWFAVRGWRAMIDARIHELHDGETL